MLYKFIYLSLIARIQAEVTDIKHIDLYNNQPSMDKTENPYPLPALFIEFKPVSWQHQGDGRRMADMDFCFHLECSRVGMENAARTGEDARNVGLEYLELLNTLYVALAGHNDGNTVVGYGALTATSDQLNTNTAVAREDIFTFKSHVVDDSACPVYTTVTRPQEITVKRT